MKVRHFPGRGFTLIELLVVIAIISLLVSILLPSLQQAREVAIKAKCLSQLKGVGTAMHMYVQDNGIFPLCYIPIGKEGTTIEESYWPQRLTMYANGQTMVCPNYEKLRPMESKENYYRLFCSGTPSPRYGFNHRVLGCGGYSKVGFCCVDDDGTVKVKTNPDNVLRPSDLVMCHDNGVTFGNAPAIFAGKVWARNSYFLEGDVLHTGGVNVVFVDTHTEWTDFDDENYWWEDDKHWVNK